MGKKSGSETAVGVLQAFRRRRHWRQAELARVLEVTVETVVRVIRELCDAGVPLTRDESDRPQVWWTVPRDWAPAGIFFPKEQTPALLRALMRSPRGKERGALLDHAVRNAPRVVSNHEQATSPSLSVPEEAWLQVVEESASKRSPLGMRYFSAHRGASEWRYVSVQRVMTGPPSRFVAVCHRTRKLKWFRVENIAMANVEPPADYRKHDPDAVREFIEASIDGFHGDGEAKHSTFLVLDPDALWVRHNLLEGMRIDPNESVGRAVRVHCETAGVVRVARFVVGLGAAARAETPELAACVRDLARGALDGVEAVKERAKRLRTGGARGR